MNKNENAAKMGFAREAEKTEKAVLGVFNGEKCGVAAAAAKSLALLRCIVEIQEIGLHKREFDRAALTVDGKGKIVVCAVYQLTDGDRSNRTAFESAKQIERLVGVGLPKTAVASCSLGIGDLRNTVHAFKFAAEGVD